MNSARNDIGENNRGFVGAERWKGYTERGLECGGARRALEINKT
jgi:hypothetical protein